VRGARRSSIGRWTAAAIRLSAMHNHHIGS
jgi:hypothetical protein